MGAEEPKQAGREAETPSTGKMCFRTAANLHLLTLCAIASLNTIGGSRLTSRAVPRSVVNLVPGESGELLQPTLMRVLMRATVGPTAADHEEHLTDESLARPLQKDEIMSGRGTQVCHQERAQW